MNAPVACIVRMKANHGSLHVLSMAVSAIGTATGRASGGCNHCRVGDSVSVDTQPLALGPTSFGAAVRNQQHFLIPGPLE